MADATEATVPQLDRAKVLSFGQTLFARFEKYQKDRRATEMQWLRNLRQFRGLYDPDIERRIPADQSHAYPKVTRTKVIGTLSRLMEMMFPQTEKNWGIKESPLPDLSETDLQLVLDELTKETPQPTDDQIEAAIKSFAAAKAERMSLMMDDQLDEISYIDLARKVISSGILYSCGILKGPQVVQKKARKWTRDPLTGKLKAVSVEMYAPEYAPVSVWDWYPDLSAKTFAQMDGSYMRHIMSRVQFSELAKRPDFFVEEVQAYLSQNTAGNYKELHWETELRARGDRENVTDLSSRKYELWEWWGIVSGHELRACGVSIKDDELASEFEANVWGIDKAILKCKLNPYDASIRPYHVFVFEEDDINLLGNGLPNVMRDSQLAICEASRMILDNASVVCGPILEMNEDLLTPGQSLDIHAFKVFLRQGTGADSSLPAVRAIDVDSHIPDLTSIINLFMSFADTETALPPSALGDVTQGGSEAMRTQGNLSMLMGAASLPIRDTVRNYDRFTTSFISSLYYWNMQFNTDETIKGDYSVIARGSTSLIAKEVRSINLDQFSLTLTPEEKMHLKTRKVLEERMKVRDLPLDLLEDEEVVNTKLAEQAANAQANAAASAALLRAQVRSEIAGAFKDFALAIKAQAGANVDTFTAVMEGIANAEGGAAGGKGAGTGAAKGS